ncbi:WD40 domain-containing protein [Rhizoctonia solani]|uniref:WD40 domain-containing protein n=1 Tax=Rhizoctonia solani TaxID=456999 RepID=A0A8H8T0B6_9AGAM|nr:WD40 domain-containing protein [Rhizoctonia solani]QRW23502.1 WD40 domain-containing protein [Rhizoctonia solani]
MTLPNTIQTRISALEKRLSKCKRQLARLQQSDEGDRFEKARDEVFIGILKDACSLVREGELASAPYLSELAKAVDRILDDAIGYSYGRESDSSELDEGLYDFMPSWAHDDAGHRPLIPDKDADKFFLPPAALESFARIFRSRLGPGDLSELMPKAWSSAMKRHPKSTKLSRVRSNLPPLTPTNDKPWAASVLDARCEISSSRCSAPIRFLTSLDSTCLALTGMGGYKNRSPALEYFILNKPLAPSTDFPDRHWYEPKLAGVAFHGMIDEGRRLIFLGDDDRIKSYEWGSSTEVYRDPLPVHTLDTESCRGPMMGLPNGFVVRAGKGNAGVYNIESLPTHGEDGDEIVGEEIDLDDFDTMRDDPEEIEPSSGSAPTSHIKFVDHPEFKPNTWQPLISSPSTVICAEYAREGGQYSCIGIDLETGKTAMHYLGHGADISAFSVSKTDPQLFLSACNDGFARLYDTRRPLPVVTFDACGQNEFCEAAAFAHPDSIPIVFTGTHKAEQIKVWDVRARACVYELATGNNGVQSLSWDAPNNCLYAATECEYMDRLGYHHDYRPAKIPKDQRGHMELEDEESDDEFSDRCWPDKAWHKEGYFGYMFDCGDHRIIRYAFKEDPNPTVMPEYGDATARDDYW